MVASLAAVQSALDAARSLTQDVYARRCINGNA